MLFEAASALVDEDAQEREDALRKVAYENRWAELDEDDDVPALEPGRLWHSLPSFPPGEYSKLIGLSGREYSRTLECCCEVRIGDWPRGLCIQLVEWPWFDPLILLTILANCLTMASVSPLDPPGTPKAAFIDTCEWVFLAIFTVELLAKVLAYGLYSHKHAYLRDAWCQLDFVVVSLAWLPILFPDMGNFGVVRAVRA